MEYEPMVVQAVAGDHHTVYAYFSDGTVRLADIEPLIQQGGVFSKLKEDDFFRDRLTVMNGAVAWDVTGTRDETKCIDLDPYEMYDKSPIVSDPLADETGRLKQFIQLGFSPQVRKTRWHGSVGRAHRSHRWGRWFESNCHHHSEPL